MNHRMRFCFDLTHNFLSVITPVWISRVGVMLCHKCGKELNVDDEVFVKKIKGSRSRYYCVSCAELVHLL